MALETDIQNDKFPYLARQFGGDIATAFGYGIDHVYEDDLEFLEFLTNFKIDTLWGNWLDQLGIIIGFPRPYVIKPFEVFEFDSTSFMLEGLYHGFSTTDPITIDGVEYDRNDGGILDDIYRETTETPISDALYKKYLYAITLLRKVHSMKNISEVLEQFIDSTRYAILYNNEPGFVNDIVIVLAATSADYKESLQIAFDKIFVTPPFVVIDVSVYFDDIYTVPEIERIIADVTGTDTGYTVVYSIEHKKAVFTITLDNSLAQYEDEVRMAVEAHFAGANDVVIIVQVE